MKPLKLTLTAFGPYKDEETIDFAELQGHRLFVVSGNTGAGKTSIFDAICYALYGEASGEDRSESRMLRSHFAGDEVYTSVDFTFELRGRVYRVFRQMGHVKAGNKSTTGDRHELYRVVGGQETPLTDRQIVSQVNQKLLELLGLNKDQFSQIVMLPQGEFRKLLTSDTENKEEILRRIFRTSLYKVVADRLNERRRQMQRIFEGLAAQRTALYAQVKGSLGGRDGSELAGVFAQEQYNTHQVVAALEQEVEFYAARLAELREQLQAETARHQAETAVYHQAKAVNEQFAQLDAKVAVRQRLEGQEQEFLGKRERLKRADDAVHLQVYERHAAESASELARKGVALEAAATELAAAEAALGEARGRYDAAVAAAPQREQALRELERWQGLLPTVRELDRRRQQAAALAAEAEALAAKLREAGAAMEARQAERAAAAERVRALEAQAAALPERTERLALLREQAAAVKECLALTAQAREERRAEQALAEVFAQAESACALVEARWLEGQAGVLARHLHDGEACPVCGSVQHPHKAASTDEVPSKEELAQARAERSAREREFAAAKAKAAATEQLLAGRREQVLAHHFDIEMLSEQFDALVGEGKALAQEVERLKAAAAELSKLKPAQAALEAQVEQAAKLKEELTGRSHAKSTEHATEQALYEQALATVPEEVRELAALERCIKETEARRARLEAEWKEAEQRFQAGTERHVKAVAGRDHAAAQQLEAQEGARRARKEFDEALRQAAFEREESYYAAKMDERARGELKREIEQYDTTLATVRAQAAELSAALAGKERQDLAALEQGLSAAEQWIEGLRGEVVQTENLRKQGTESKANLLEAEKLCATAERDLAQVKDLYDVVRGDNSKKISFERYLQIEFLEQIVHVANQRLQTMSNGQFYLVRSDRLEIRGKQSGLGLDVYDSYTGMLRDVKSLSGGEKFNASLCLALGMADVIQAYEGGISLETMFIDEGFGSLDEEALTKAIDTLIDLQQSGRMIGVISHVQELKQAIPAVLEVRKTKEGHSFTRFLVS
jgi:exonuclease SbcC